MRRSLGVLLPIVLVLAACADDDETTPTVTADQSPTDAVEGFAFAGGDVADGEPIDSTYTCDGAGISPALAWQEIPDGTAELALIVEDPDAPGGTFTHWVVYAMPPNYTGLDSGVPPGPSLSGAIILRQGPNDGSDTPGYLGPCPPGGETHDYVFTLYALDAESGLEGGASVDDLRTAIEGHVLGEATLTAPYSRP